MNKQERQIQARLKWVKMNEELEGLHLYSPASFGLTPNEFQQWEKYKPK